MRVIRCKQIEEKVKVASRGVGFSQRLQRCKGRRGERVKGVRSTKYNEPSKKGGGNLGEWFDRPSLSGGNLTNRGSAGSATKGKGYKVQSTMNQVKGRGLAVLP